MYFSHKLVFDDGDQRVELIYFGHAHTAGDAVACGAQTWHLGLQAMRA